MKQQRTGSIINIASIAAITGVIVVFTQMVCLPRELIMHLQKQRSLV
jgi:hypothetical protein